MRTSKARKPSERKCHRLKAFLGRVVRKPPRSSGLKRNNTAVSLAVDNVTIQSLNQGGTAGISLAPFGAGVFCFCKAKKTINNNGALTKVF